MIRYFFWLLAVVTFAWSQVTPAAQRGDLYLPYLQDKRVALIVNPSSIVGEIHLVDYLLSKGVKVVKIFAPEHGFRGDVDAGSHIKNSKDSKTDLPIISLYGHHTKPTKNDLAGVDILLFDIQDVGVRFYTYLSTLHLVMESAGEQGIPLIVLDRPNPNAHYIDGAMLQREYRSFVGLDPVPLVYGMTIGEYALMLRGEGWIGSAKQLQLKVIPLADYNHQIPYSLPIKPSPNLPNDRSIALYPSLAFFEGTTFSAGRGTLKQFQLYGDPLYNNKSFSFIPKPQEGAKHPKHQGKRCYGVDLFHRSIQSIRAEKEINLSYLLDAYSRYPNKKAFFLKNNFIDNLAGNNQLRQQILSGKSEAQIRASWQHDLQKFKKIRQKYLLYR